MRCFTLILLSNLICFSAYAHVDLVYPEGGDKFIANDIVTIKWAEVQAHNTQNWELYFSPDGGETWLEISKNIGVSDREYNWVVPEIETAKGRIRVVQNNEGEDYDDVSPNFSIEMPQAIGDGQNTFSTFILFPNPAKETLTCSFHLPDNSEVQIMLTDSHGKTIGLLFNHPLAAGNHDLLLNISHLKPGLYFCLIRMDEKMSTRKLLISS